MLVKRSDDFAFGIRERILVAFVVLLLIPMSVLGGISYFGIKKVGTTATSGSVSALEQQETAHLLNISADQADTTDQVLAGIKADTEALRRYAEDLFNRRTEYGTGAYPAYNYSGKTLSPALPSYGYINQSAGEGKGAWADWDQKLLGSPYLNSSVVKRAEAEPAYAAWVTYELNTTMQLDLALRPAYDKNQPNVVLTWFSRAGGISSSSVIERMRPPAMAMPALRAPPGVTTRPPSRARSAPSGGMGAGAESSWLSAIRVTSGLIVVRKHRTDRRDRADPADQPP